MLSLFFPVAVFAADATMEISPSVGTYNVYEDVTLHVTVTSNGKFVNAVEGRLSFNPKELTVTHVTHDDSPVTSWTQEPSVDSELGTVLFGGALATSTRLAGTTILTLRVRPERVGEMRLRFEGGAAIISADGLGTNVLTGFKSGKYRIQPEEFSDEAVAATPASTPALGEVLGVATIVAAPPADHTPPADFVLAEVEGREESDPVVVVTVAATDTLSGIAYYTFAVDGGEAVQWQDRGSHHFVYRATTLGVHTLSGVVYDRAGNTSTQILRSTISASSSASLLSGEGTDEALVLHAPAAASLFGMVSRHPFMPIALLLFMLVTWWCVRTWHMLPSNIAEDDLKNEEDTIGAFDAQTPTSVSLGQVVLAPRTQK
jgi:hypothetical protein